MNKRAPIRDPIRRQRAEFYLLVTLLSFATSVSFTRLFLYLTGYPQIGNSELHVAHVLWGGLLLFIASLLPLIFANRWVYSVCALLSGIGVGLFIDEVGKFITRSNDYFYPWAAPIIYVFFLLVVLLYVRIRRPRQKDYRRELYYLLEDLQEVLDKDLSDREKQDILDHLHQVKRQTEHPEYVQLAQNIEDFIRSESLYLVPHVETFWERAANELRAFEKKILSRSRYRLVIFLSLLGLAAWSMIYPFYVLATVFFPRPVEEVLYNLLSERLVQSSSALTWYEAMLSLEITTGLILLLAAVFLMIRRERRGLLLGNIGLLFALTVVNILIFYFNQFSTILISAFQFFVLLLAARYRALYHNRRPQNNQVL